MNNNRICSGSSNLIFACSGAADVGALSDQAARHMTAKGFGKMYCLAGIGGDIKGIVDTSKDAEQLLAIDGCPVGCTKKLLENKGFKDFNYMLLTEMGFKKGDTKITNDAIQIVSMEGAKLLAKK